MEHDLSNTSLSNHSKKNYGPKEAELLSKNTTITILNLSFNQIGPSGALSLSKNTTITDLNLSSNLIGDSGAISLYQNTTLTSLNLSGNQIQEVIEARIKRSISINQISQIKRRNTFILSMILLERDSKHPNSSSIWRQFPRDIRNYILSIFSFNESPFLSLGKTPQQIHSITLFIQENIHPLNEILKQKRIIKIIEKGKRYSLQEKLPSKPGKSSCTIQ